jgi:hypothetical protein
MVLQYRKFIGLEIAEVLDDVLREQVEQVNLLGCVLLAGMSLQVVD